MVGRSGGVAVLRCGTAATASLDADSGIPCGEQVFGAHNDVGAGTGGKPAGADRVETRTAGMGVTLRAPASSAISVLFTATRGRHLMVPTVAMSSAVRATMPTSTELPRFHQ